MKKITRSEFFSASGYTLVIFAAIVICGLFDSTVKNIDVFYGMYLGDFSIGFCSRLLLGQILSLFKDTFTIEWMTAFVFTATYIILLSACIYPGITLAKADRQIKTPLLFFAFLLVIIPQSLCTYLRETFGFMDVFLLAVFVLTVFLCEIKYAQLLFPLLLPAGIMLHDSFVFAYMTPCLAIIAYHAIKNNRHKIMSAVVFILSSLTSLAFTLYSTFFATQTVKMTESQMYEYLAAKGCCEITDVQGYLEAYLFLKNTYGGGYNDYATSLLDVIKHMVLLAQNGSNGTQIIHTVACIPFILLVFCIWIKCAKNSDGFLEKAPYILFMLTTIPIMIAATIISMDYFRFFSVIIITQLFFVFICAKNKDAALMPVLRSLGEKPVIFILTIVPVVFANMN